MAPTIEVSNEQLRVMNVLGIRYNLLKTETPKITPIAELDRSTWIVIPWEFTDGKYSLKVSPERLAYCPAVEKVGKELEINYRNTSRDSLGREFIGNNDWFESLKINLCLGNSTLPPKQFVDFGRLLYRGMEEEIKVYNASGKQLDAKFLENVFYDIFGEKFPWRAEWLDADFKIKDKDLCVNYNHILDKNGNLIPQNSEILDKNTLMKDRTPGISLEKYLDLEHTNQGLPTKKIESGEIESGDLSYWFLRKDNDSVARFGATVAWHDLNCYWDPSSRGAYLGGRGCLACEK